MLLVTGVNKDSLQFAAAMNMRGKLARLCRECDAAFSNRPGANRFSPCIWAACSEEWKGLVPIDRVSLMRPLHVIAIFSFLIATPLPAADELQDLLLDKFRSQNQLDHERLRTVVVEAVTKAGELKETDPDRGIDLLRVASNRIDGVKLLNVAERKALTELIQPLIAECRDNSLRKRRERASLRVDAFKEYLEISAFEGRFPGRSGAEHWEPANFMAPDGTSRVGRLYTLGTGAITFKFGPKELHQPPSNFPLIQVFGGFYVFDKNAGYQVFLTNREFYDSVLLPLVREYDRSDTPGKTLRTTAELARRPNPRRLQASIDSGEFFLRSLPDLEPIPGVSANEGPFLEFVAQSLMHKAMPISIDRIYPVDLQDRLVGFSKIQLSAVRRSLQLLQAKDVAVSPLYAEIMREETSQLLKSEYANFGQGEINRAVLYIFSKLK